MFSLLFLSLIAISGTFGNPSNEIETSIISQQNFTAPQFERIIIKPNLTGIFNLTSPSKSYRIINTSHRFKHKLPVNIIYETENSFYLVTSIESSSSELNVNINYRVNPKKVLSSRYHYLVKKSEHSHNYLIELVIKNLNFTEFLKRENDLIKYFNDDLSNNVVVSSIQSKGRNFKITLANSEPASYRTKKLVNSTCESESKEFTNKTGLQLVPCSLKFDNTPVNSTWRESNDLELDIELAISGGLGINVNYVLMLVLVLVEVWFFV